MIDYFKTKEEALFPARAGVILPLRPSEMPYNDFSPRVRG